MITGVRNVIWNIRLRGWDYIKQYAGYAAAISSVSFICGAAVYKTRYALNRIVASSALERERGGRPEYLFVNDPAYEERIRQHLEDEDAWSPGPVLGRWIGGFRRAYWRRLIHISRNGSPSDRQKALHHLSAIKHLKVDEWEWTWLSQRLDARSVVWLARHGGKCAWRLTGGIPPLPVTADSSHLTALTSVVNNTKAKGRCRCLNTYIQEQLDHQQDVQRLMEQETSAGENKQNDENAEMLTCLESLLHHFDLNSTPSKSELTAEEVFVKNGGLTFIKQVASSSDRSLQILAARIIMKLSHFPDLLPMYHRAGIISILALWIEKTDSKNAELCCMAAGALASLEDGTNEEKRTKELYGPAVQLLYPINHTMKPPQIDAVFVHGLLGEPFVTWRQRDGIGEDANLQNNIIYDEDEIISSKNKVEVVLRDIPEFSMRDSSYTDLSYKDNYKLAQDEFTDLTSRTQCWPRDWLPYDCTNIRVLGVSYDTMMMEWNTGCRNDGNIEDRARVLGAALQKAGVGSRPIVWITHSMGGLIVKYMLVQSMEAKNEEEQQMAKNTKGIVFFSTPHHGSRAAHTLIWPSKEIQDIRQDSKVLGKLHKKWLTGGWPSICIGESKPTKLLSFPGLSLHLVPPDSANDNLGPFYTLPLDHLDICKPATRHSFIYRIVVDMIQHAKGEKCRNENCTECTKKTDNSDKNIVLRIFDEVMTFFFTII